MFTLCKIHTSGTTSNKQKNYVLHKSWLVNCQNIETVLVEITLVEIVLVEHVKAM